MFIILILLAYFFSGVLVVSTLTANFSTTFSVFSVSGIFQSVSQTTWEKHACLYVSLYVMCRDGLDRRARKKPYWWGVNQTVNRQNVPRHKVPGTYCKVPGTKRPRDKTSQGQNGAREKTSYSNYQIFNNKIVLENWQHTRMLGNGPQPCTKFVIGVFLFWGG